ncbi:hypothetical protein V6B16_11470 [Salinimicrobium catena]|uniref:hypothetical protein n=1 Tax=Salinimicrobium catena TaxID=390640 RepID=UPI002FE4C36C
MIFTFLTIQDLIDRAGKEAIKDLPSLAQELELRHPKEYQYRLVLRFMIEEDENRSRRIKEGFSVTFLRYWK